MLLAVALLMRYVLPGLLRRLAFIRRIADVVCKIAWAVPSAVMGDILGFSREVGAFLAGVSIASTRIGNRWRLVWLAARFFCCCFLHRAGGNPRPEHAGGTTFSLSGVLAVRTHRQPIDCHDYYGLYGYRKRTGFLAGLTVAQISEFSLILAALGLSLGHLGRTRSASSRWSALSLSVPRPT